MKDRGDFDEDDRGDNKFGEGQNWDQVREEKKWIPTKVSCMFNIIDVWEDDGV